MPQYRLDSDSRGARVIAQAVPRRFNWYRFFINLRAFFTRFLTLAHNPRRFAPLAADFWVLIESLWSKRKLGPDIVYPLLSIRKRRSGRLAKLILEHIREQSIYDLNASPNHSQGIDLPCVTVIDLDRMTPSGYSTRVDLYGLMWMLICVRTTLALVVHVFHLYDKGWFTVLGHWLACAWYGLMRCRYAVFRGTLILAPRSDTSTPGAGVLLDGELTMILNGAQSAVEAISENRFNLYHPDSAGGIRLPEGQRRNSPKDILETLCDAVCLVIFALCWLSFRPSSLLYRFALPTVTVGMMGLALDLVARVRGKGSQLLYRVLPATYILMREEWLTFIVTLISWLITTAFLLGYDAQNYPIRAARLLEALGHPEIRTWQFNTLAAAATFQCLVLCRDTTRPIRKIDISAFLDMLIPDQRDVWKAWKSRVADRIIFEADIDFAPMVPTFPDERQRQLKDLLDEAQSAYGIYKRAFN